MRKLCVLLFLLILSCVQPSHVTEPVREEVIEVGVIPSVPAPAKQEVPRKEYDAGDFSFVGPVDLVAVPTQGVGEGGRFVGSTLKLTWYLTAAGGGQMLVPAQVNDVVVHGRPGRLARYEFAGGRETIELTIFPLAYHPGGFLLTISYLAEGRDDADALVQSIRFKREHAEEMAEWEARERERTLEWLAKSKGCVVVCTADVSFVCNPKTGEKLMTASTCSDCPGVKNQDVGHMEREGWVLC